MIDFIKRRYANESGIGLRSAIILDLILVALVTVGVVRYGVMIVQILW